MVHQDKLASLGLLVYRAAQETLDLWEQPELRVTGVSLVCKDFPDPLDQLARKDRQARTARTENLEPREAGDLRVWMGLLGPWATPDLQDPEDHQERRVSAVLRVSLDLTVPPVLPAREAEWTWLQ